MILTILITSICLIFISSSTILLIKANGYSDYEEFHFFSIVLSIITILILCLILILNNTMVNIKVAELEVEKEILIAKVERLESSDFINGDFGSLEDTYKEVLYFNMHIISHKEKSKNIWLNWFYRKEIGEVGTIQFGKD